MYCPNCGTTCRDTDRFCPNCGSALPAVPAADPSPAPQAPRPAPAARERVKGWLIPLLSLVLTAAIGIGGFFAWKAFFGKDGSLPGKSDGLSLEKITESLAPVIDAAESFENSRGKVPADQADDAIRAVYRAAKELEIVESCKKDDYGVVIHLKDGPTYVYVPAVELRDAGSDELRVITLQPYHTENIKEDPNMDLDSPDCCARLLDAEDEWVFDDKDNLDDSKVSIKRLLGLDQYKLILWQGHGGYTEETGYLLGTTIDVDQDLLDNEESLFNVPFYLDLHNRLLLTPEFFSENYEADAFKDAILYFGTCYSGKDSTLAQTFLDLGAVAVFGNNESIYRDYNLNMIHLIIESFLTNGFGDLTAQRLAGMDISLQSKAGNWTLADALALGKAAYGADDDSEERAEVCLFGGDAAESLTYEIWMNRLHGSVVGTTDSPVAEVFAFRRADAYPAVAEWEDFRYAIPNFTFDTADAELANAEINDRFLRDAQYCKEHAADDDLFAYLDWGDVSYQTYMNGDVVSLVIHGEYVFEGRNFYIYNFSLSTGKRLSDSELIAAWGGSYDEYARLNHEAVLSAYWDWTWPAMEQNIQLSDDPNSMWVYYEQSFYDTQKLMAESVPFLGSDGKLWISGAFGVPAGSGVARGLLCLEPVNHSPYYSDVFVHPEVPENRTDDVYREAIHDKVRETGLAVHTAVLADVTRDNLPELILVLDGEYEYRGYVFSYNPAEDSLTLLEERFGGISHAQGFFGWYLRECSEGYELLSESFGMWQGVGELNLECYYLTPFGQRVITESHVLAAEEMDSLTNDDFDAYRQEVSSVLAFSMILGYEFSEGDGDHMDVDPALLFQY